MDQMKLFIDSKITPLENYTGRKGSAGVAQKILSEIPKCSLFIDAMCGSGYIGSQVKGCQVIFNDRDNNVIKRLKIPSEFALFLNEDYKQIVKRYDNGAKERIFFFDPPYLMETRKQQIRMFNYDWTNKDHTDFVEITRNMKCPVMICQYPNKLYAEAFKKWRKLEYTSMTRKGARTEVLYMNFKQPVLLQCFEHVGKDYIDRQRLKRKINLLLQRFDKLEGKERAAILSSIIDHYNYVISK